MILEVFIGFRLMGKSGLNPASSDLIVGERYFSGIRAFSASSWCSAFVAPFLCGLALGMMEGEVRAATSISEPVACVRVTIPAPTAGGATRKVLGIPFNRPSAFRGVLTAVSGTTLKCGAPLWTAGQFTDALYYVKMRSGTNQGRYFPIADNGTDSVRVLAPGVTFAVRDAFEIFPAQTLGALLGSTAATVSLRQAATVGDADLVRIHDGTDWVTCFFNGTEWCKQAADGAVAGQNDLVIKPEQGVIIVCGGTSEVKLTLFGNVSVTPELSAVPVSGQALLSPRFPVATTLATLNLQGLSGWTKGGAASVADNVLSWNGSSWDIFYHTGARWQKVGSVASQDGAVINPGEAFLIRRRDGASETPPLKTAVPFVFKATE